MPQKQDYKAVWDRLFFGSLPVSSMHLDTPTTMTLSEIPSGPRGIWDTLKIMGSLMRQGKTKVAIRMKALSLIRNCAQKDAACEIEQLHSFVRDQVRYVNDIEGVETVATPEKTLESMAGDCDDKATLLAALLATIGYKTRFTAIGFEPGVFSHVYVEVKLREHWFPLETTEPVQAGWSPDPALIRAGPMSFIN